MSSHEITAQPTPSQEEPTASAATANPLPQQRPNRVNRFTSWVWLVAGVVLIVLAIAAIFFAGFFVGRQYGGGSGSYYVVPGQGCIQMQCQPAGPHGGAQCFQKRVACPSG
jgi:hypothetical protein